VSVVRHFVSYFAVRIGVTVLAAPRSRSTYASAVADASEEVDPHAIGHHYAVSYDDVERRAPDIATESVLAG
jgi:hypothetical protein